LELIELYSIWSIVACRNPWIIAMRLYISLGIELNSKVTHALVEIMELAGFPVKYCEVAGSSLLAGPNLRSMIHLNYRG
jgi:hypothetical protein